jgi:hypothetical protein
MPHGHRSGALWLRINWRSTEVVKDMIGAPCLIFDVEMELLQVCGPLLMGCSSIFPLYA